MAESSWIKSVEFEEPNKLHVYTHSGKHYVYFGVSKDVYEEMKKSKSMGAYFNQNLRKNHPGKLS